MLASLLSPKLIVLYAFIASAVYVHFRGRVRHRFFRQLTDHSSLMAPYNVLMYAFSAVPNKPYLDLATFPELTPLAENWKAIRDEALQLVRRRPHPRAGQVQRHRLPFLLQGRLQALLREVVRRAAAVGESAVPEDRGARHRDSLRQRGDVRDAAAGRQARRPPRSVRRARCAITSASSTPNAESCRIVVDGEPYHWRDGEAVIFDETFIHIAENRSDAARLILFCDIERPLAPRPDRLAQSRVPEHGDPREPDRERRGREGGPRQPDLQLRLPRAPVRQARQGTSRFAYYVLKWLLIGGVFAAIYVHLGRSKGESAPSTVASSKSLHRPRRGQRHGARAARTPPRR